MFNSYTEEFKRNAVAVVRSGYGIGCLAKRLNIPPTSIRNWLAHPKYSAVKPADEDLLSKVPERRLEPKDLVKIGDNTVFINKNCLPEIEIKIGNAVIKVPKNITKEAFTVLIQALRDSHVL